MRVRIVTQTKNVESGGMMDDCAWASLACVANVLLGSKLTCTDGIAVGEMVGRHDRDGKGDGSSLSQMAKGAHLMGIDTKQPDDWAEVVNAMRKGHVIGISVEQPNKYPATVRLSKWHKGWQSRNPGKSYGHLTCAADVDGVVAQWADPTMDGKGLEKFALVLAYNDLKAIASSHGDAPHTRCLIFKLPEVAEEKHAGAGADAHKKL